MSFPSSGKMALYRNNIRDVAKYLDTAHGPGSYKVYNLCSEKSYDGSYFHDSVARYSIDDHNVPTLEQMLEFAKDVKDFIEAKDKNVIAVHCKGKELFFMYEKIIITRTLFDIKLSEMRTCLEFCWKSTV